MPDTYARRKDRNIARRAELRYLISTPPPLLHSCTPPPLQTFLKLKLYAEEAHLLFGAFESRDGN
jgi:hypothetical protein